MTTLYQRQVRWYCSVAMRKIALRATSKIGELVCGVQMSESKTAGPSVVHYAARQGGRMQCYAKLCCSCVVCNDDTVHSTVSLRRQQFLVTSSGGAQHCIALRCIRMHCLALRTGAEPRHNAPTPRLLAKPCTLVHLPSTGFCFDSHLWLLCWHAVSCTMHATV